MTKAESEKEYRHFGKVTNFGQIIIETNYLAQYSMNELVERGSLTKTEAERISRLSRSTDHAGGLREPEVFADRVSTAISGYAAEKFNGSDDARAAYNNFLRHQLVEALEKDKRERYDDRTARIVVSRFQEAFGNMNIFDLYVAVHTGYNPEVNAVLERLKALKANQTPQGNQ